MLLTAVLKREWALIIKPRIWLIVALLLCTARIGTAEVNAAAEPAAQRIIALSPHSVELLFAIGAGDRIVATIDSSDHPRQAKNIESVGSYRGVVIEKILALKPDLIITWASGNKINQIEQLKSLGFNVINSEPESLLEISQDLRKLGRLTGLSANAETVARDFEQQLSAIVSRYRNREKVRVFYQLWSKPLMTISNKSWINQFIEGCGAINVFADSESAYPQISIENVLLTNPQVFLIPKDEQTRSHALFNWQHWQYIDAIKNNHIYYPNGTLLHRPTPRVLTAMNEMCQQIDMARQQ